MALLEPFLHAMSAADAPTAPGDIARLLCVSVEQAYRDLDLHEAEVFADSATVTMFPTHASAWEAVVVGANAYRLYPGVMKDDGETIVWPNVWVAADYDLETFTSALEQELANAAAG